MLNYYINRQIENGNCRREKTKKQQYAQFLHSIARIFTGMAVTFESEYIFCWLDWDGDNILMDGGIIDYGSQRQFGLFHHEYRYDDIERFSITIIEKKAKARYIMQTFAQIVDFLITGKKKNIKLFRKHSATSAFDCAFREHKEYLMLYKVGLRDDRIEKALKNKHTNSELEQLMKCFAYFEKAKSRRGFYEVEDGVTWDAIFCMRDLLRELPTCFLASDEPMGCLQFIDIIRSDYADDSDARITRG